MTTSSEDSYGKEEHKYKEEQSDGDESETVTPMRNQGSAKSGPFEATENYTDFTEDGDVIERIRSRASATSDFRKIKALREKYREGFFEMSADDPRRPQNWPTRKRVLHTITFGLSTFSALLGATVFAPAGFQLAEQKQLGSEMGVLAFSIYLLGTMIGPTFITPLADAYGRKLCVLTPLFLSGIFLCIVANSDSMAAVVVYRFLAGVFASSAVSSSSGAVADMWRTKVRASALVLFSVNFSVGVVIPPILGALLLETGSYGWRWCSWLGGLLSLVVSSLSMLFLDETLLPVVEKTVAKSIRLESGYWGLHTTHDKYNELTFTQTLLIYFKQPLVMMAIPNVFGAVLCSSYANGVLFLLITTVGEQFQIYHNFSSAASQCALVGLLIGHFFGCLANLAASRRYAAIYSELGHNPSPEVRLPPMMFLGWLMPAGLFIYGWTMRSSIHWIVPIVGLGITGAGMATIFQGCTNYLTDAYTNNAASAQIANVIMRYVFAGVFPLFARQLYSTLKVHWATSLLGFISIAFIPISWLLFFFGGRYRQHDPYGKPFEI